MTQPRLLGGRYELGELLGRGGMAEVHRARDLRLGRVVAVKMLRDRPGPRPDVPGPVPPRGAVRRLAEPPGDRRGLRHRRGHAPTARPPVPVHRDGVRRRPDPARHPARGPAAAARAGPGDHRRRAARRWTTATAHGIIHRDIKPANVMLTRTGDVKVMDFGIARAVADAQATMTQTAAVIGTAQYLSPEQARGETVDARCDVYSTGCLLYELLTGRPPFIGDSPGRGRLPARAGGPDPAVAGRPRDARRGRRDRAQGAGQGPERPLPVRRRDAHRHRAGAVRACRSRRRPARTCTRAPGRWPRDDAGRRDQRDPGLPVRPRGPAARGEGRRRGWLWAIIALVAALVLGGGFYVFHYVSGKGGSISVPSVAGKTEKRPRT